MNEGMDSRSEYLAKQGAGHVAVSEIETDSEKAALLNNVTSDGIQFMRSIVAMYGAEQGMELWNQFDAMGQEAKHRIFIAMLSGNRSNSGITVRAGPLAMRLNNAVPIIKCFRLFTGMGLKEAKDAWDRSKSGSVEIKCPAGMRHRMIIELRELGCTCDG